MASVKVSAIRKTLDAFADLYDRAGSVQNAQALRNFSSAMSLADKRTVDDLVNMLSTGGQPSAVSPKVPNGH